MAARHTSGSRTTPRPRETSARPASNWGLTRRRRSAPGAIVGSHSTGTTRTNEMKERSAVTTSRGVHEPPAPSRASPDNVRMFVRSSTRTRGSARNLGSSCPWPTSRATTDAAPCWSRQSVNPPVEAPTSRARRRVTSTAKRLSAASSFSPPRPTKRGRGPREDDRFAGCDEAGRLVGDRTADQDRSGLDRGLGLLAAGSEPPPHQLMVEPSAWSAQLPVPDRRAVSVDPVRSGSALTCTDPA